MSYVDGEGETQEFEDLAIDEVGNVGEEEAVVASIKNKELGEDVIGIIFTPKNAIIITEVKSIMYYEFREYYALTTKSDVVKQLVEVNIEDSEEEY